MGRLAQVGWNKSVQEDLKALAGEIENATIVAREHNAIKEKQIWAINERFAALEARIEALEQKRGPGRPKNEHPK